MKEKTTMNHNASNRACHGLADARIIKFRGFQKSWIYGGISIFQNEATIFDVNCIANSAYEVEINSVGQFTGYLDVNGKEIYEGDILGDWNEIDGKMEQSKQTVYFDEMLGQWMLDNSFKQDRSLSYSLFSELQDFEYEIIGNVYENPELLTPNNPTHETTKI